MSLKNFAIIVLVLCGAYSSCARIASAQAFQHPGVLVSRAQLDFIKAQVKAKVEPFYSQFQLAQANEYGDLNYKIKGPPENGVVACGPFAKPDFGCHDECSDASAAYLQALLWYITDNRTYADNAIRIMNAYGRNLKAYSLSNAPLQAAWSSSKWPRAAEIIRYSNAGWAPADIQAFSDMLTKIELPLIYDGSKADGNWELSMIEGMMGIAVFTENHDLFDHAAEMWTQRVPSTIYYAPFDGNHPVPVPRAADCWPRCYWRAQTVFNASLNGIPQEVCDGLGGHVQYSFSAMMAAAETAHIQGLSLFESEEPRLIAGMEFVAYYQLKNSAPPTICSGMLRRAEPYTTLVIGYNEYHNRLGQSLPYTKQLIENTVMTNPDPVDMHMTVFETLTHYADAQTAKSPRAAQKRRPAKGE